MTGSSDLRTSCSKENKNNGVLRRLRHQRHYHTTRKRMLLTEQTLVEVHSGEVHSRQLAFSTVDADGRGLTDDDAKLLASHFRYFHSVLMPSAKTNKAPIMSPKELREHLCTKDDRAMLICVLALSSGCKSFQEFEEVMKSRKKPDKARQNVVMAL